MRDFRIFRLRGNVPTVGFFKKILSELPQNLTRNFRGINHIMRYTNHAQLKTWLELNRGDGDFDGYRIIGFCVRVNRIEFFYSF
jgi:hypothetical protein